MSTKSIFKSGPMWVPVDVLLLQPRDQTAHVFHHIYILHSPQTICVLPLLKCGNQTSRLMILVFAALGTNVFVQTWYKWALLIFLPIAPSMHSWTWALLAAVLCRKILLALSLWWFPLPRVTAFWKKLSLLSGKKIAQSWSNIDCAIYPQRFDLAMLKGNLSLSTQFLCQFSLFSPDLLRSLITTALVFVSLANSDFLPDHWYLYWCLDCSSSESPGKKDMGFHFAGEIEDLIYCWRGK